MTTRRPDTGEPRPDRIVPMRVGAFDFHIVDRHSAGWPLVPMRPILDVLDLGAKREPATRPARVWRHEAHGWCTDPAYLWTLSGLLRHRILTAAEWRRHGGDLDRLPPLARMRWTVEYPAWTCGQHRPSPSAWLHAGILTDDGVSARDAAKLVILRALELCVSTSGAGRLAATRAFIDDYNAGLMLVGHPARDVCRKVSLRSLYRWRDRFGGRAFPARADTA